MKYKNILLLFSFLAGTTQACELTISSSFQHPQSLRYKIDSILNYSDENGYICLKRIPKVAYFKGMILHPEKMQIISFVELSRASILDGSQSVGPKEVALAYVCDGTCSKDQYEKISKHPDFILLEDEISKRVDNLESIQELITKKFKENAKSLREYTVDKVEE